MSEADADSKFAVFLLNSLAVILKTTQMHDINNAAVMQQVERLVSRLDSALAEEPVLRIDLAGDIFLLNDARVRFPMQYLLNFDYLAAEFRRRGLGTIIFKRRADVSGIQALIEAFISAGSSRNPFETLRGGLFQSDAIDVEELKHLSEDAEPPKDLRKVIKKTYFDAVSFSKGIMSKMKSKEPVSMKSATKVVRSMVDLILEEEQLLVGMTAIKDYDEYTYHHSVNVSILSIALGQKLGLGKRELTDLGLAAFFHDMGKVWIPYEVLNKPGAFTDEEWESIRRHPVAGFKNILRLKMLDPVLIGAAIASFEHHIDYDLSGGYPQLMRAMSQDIFSRIISIADRYDAMTASRIYRKTPLPPDKALGILIEDSGKKVDPLLLRVFISMLGIFPIGTFVMLNTNEFGLVCGSNPLFSDRPKVRIMFDESSMKTDYVVDLTERAPDGTFVRSIVKTVDHNKYRINVAEYLL